MTPSEPYYRKCNRCETRFPVAPLPDNRKITKVLCNECNAKKAREYRAKDILRNREYMRNYRAKNREQLNAQQMDRYRRHRTSILSKNKVRRDSNPSHVAALNLRGRFAAFGVDADWYERTLKSQGSGCAICGSLVSKGSKSSARFAIDHNHGCCGEKRACDKCRRGLLCFPCNTLLSRVEGDWLPKAMAYLDAHQTTTPEALTHAVPFHQIGIPRSVSKSMNPTETPAGLPTVVLDAGTTSAATG